MASSASAPPWIPEDDLLLKNAMEAGASFQALAKGAVRFSRSLTARELEDRWRALLYDPVVSAQAAAQMLELEFYAPVPAPAPRNVQKSNRFGNSKGAVEVSLKRKVDSIRKYYYAVQKRLCREVCNSTELDFSNNSIVNDAVSQNHTAVIKDPTNENSMVAVQISKDYGRKERCKVKKEPLTEFPHTSRTNRFAKPISGYDFMFTDLRNDTSGFGGAHHFNSPPFSDESRDPLWKMTEDISPPQMPVSMNVRDKNHDGKRHHLFKFLIKILTQILFFLDIPDCLLNLADDGGLPFMDVDAITVYKSSNDNFNSLLLNSPINSNEDDVPDGTDPKMLVMGTCIATPDGGCFPAEVDVIADVSTLSSSIVPSMDPLEVPDATVVCTLNIEDQEIPSNDDLISAKEVQLVLLDKASELASISDQKNCALESFLKNKNHARLLAATQILGPDMLPKTTSNYQFLGCTQSEPRGSRRTTNIQVQSGHCRPEYVALNSALSTGVEENATNYNLKGFYAPTTVGDHLPMPAKPRFTKKTCLQLTPYPSTSDQEESHSDDDLPSYSEIEAMILQMDLCQHGDDSLVNREVSRYQTTETKRKIVRLEQCAHSSLRRAMGSQGALAVLCGFQSKHFIKKTEVILGRATNDIGVDIDLGKEGQANKISRRQASLKLDKDGSFVLKNLGKTLISVNDKEVATGQLLKLDSNCMIEVRELRFLFEVDQKSVSRFLASGTGENTQENKATFEWSPEGFDDK